MSQEISVLLINKLNLREKTKCGFNFDSFDRFDDDLCQLLFTYFTFKEKVIYECVSKKWKSLLFNEQKVLTTLGGINFYKGIFWNHVLFKSDMLFGILLNKLQYLRSLSLIYRIDGGSLRTITNNSQY
jgi:hypothetical protein